MSEEEQSVKGEEENKERSGPVEGERKKRINFYHLSLFFHLSVHSEAGGSQVAACERFDRVKHTQREL